MQNETNSSGLGENVHFVYKLLSIPAFAIVTIVEIFKILHKIILFGLQSQEFTIALKEGCNTIYLFQGLYAVLTGCMCTFILFADRFNNSSASSKADFEGQTNDFVQVHGVIVKGEDRRTLSLVTCFLRSIILYSDSICSFSSIFY